MKGDLMESVPTKEQNSEPAAASRSVANKLASFLLRNPSTSIVCGENEVRVQKPWENTTLSLIVKADDAEFFDALINVLFPPRFTAIWH